MLIQDVLLEQVTLRPHEIAAREGDVDITYQQLYDRVAQFQGWLAASGVTPGDRIALLATPGVNYYVCLLATTGLGAIWMGLNPKHTLTEIAYAISDAAPKIVLHVGRSTDRDYGAELASLAGGPASATFVDISHGLPQFDVQGGSLADPDADGSAAAVIVYTSGSTGRPKGAQLSHDALILGSRAMIRRLGVSRVDMVNFFPINHIACTGDVTITTLIAGGTLTFQPRFDAPEILRSIAADRVSVLFVIPTMLNLMMRDAVFDLETLRALDVIAWGGAPLQRSTIDQLLQRGITLVGSYGMTEAAANTTWTPPNASAEILAETVGVPLDEYPTRIRSDGKLCEIGEPGEIEHRITFAQLGYWQRPEATREVTTEDGWYRTGDIGAWDADGCIRLVGRARQMFKSGGYNIYPREIETALECCPAVAEAIVVPASDPVYHEIGVAFVRLAAGSTASAEDLRAFARDRLANYKIPKRFVIKAALPLLAVGKIDRTALTEEARRLWTDGGTFNQKF